MHQQEFEFIMDKVLDTCQDALGTKDAEYSRGGDRLHNFYQAAEKRNNHPLEALLGMQVKHRVSIDDICNDIVREGKYPTDETLMEKIKDDINYNILCYALIHELRERAGVKTKNPLPIRTIVFKNNFYESAPEERKGLCQGCYFSESTSQCLGFKSTVNAGSCIDKGIIWKRVS